MLTVDSLCELFLCWAQNYYRKPSGRPTGRAINLKMLLRPLRETIDPIAHSSEGQPMLWQERSVPMGRLKAVEMDAERLYHVQQALATEAKRTRQNINEVIAAVKQMYDWAAEPVRKLVPQAVADGLRCVKPLKYSRSAAPEQREIASAPQTAVEMTIALAEPFIADLVEVMWWTGMRPGEACSLCISRIDTSRGEAGWIYLPIEHKTEHHGPRHSRPVPIGPKAQCVLLPRMAEAKRNGRDWLFEWRKWTGEFIEGERRYVLAGKPVPVSRAGQMLRECHDQHGIEHFTLNQLRHAAATRLDRAEDDRAAAAVLGHASPATTRKFYIDRDVERLLRIAQRHG